MALETKNDTVAQGLDDTNEELPMLKLKSGDNEVFTLPTPYAKISNLVKTSLEQDEDADEVPIPGVKGASLKLVVNWMNHRKGVDMEPPEKPLRSKELKEILKEDWLVTFWKFDDLQALYDLILAANYMDIKALLHQGCAMVAAKIKGQPLEKIKDILDPKGTGQTATSTGDEKKDD